jgi:hypothetical protein
VLTTCSRQTVAAGGGGAQSDPIARACGRAGVDRTRAWAGGLGLGPRTRSRLPVGLGAERSPSLEGLPVPYSVEPGGGASDSDRWRDPSCASRWRSVASVHGSVGGRGGGGWAYFWRRQCTCHEGRSLGRITVARERCAVGRRACAHRRRRGDRRPRSNRA